MFDVVKDPRQVGMNPLLSYVRYMVSYFLTKTALYFGLPQEGLSQAAQAAAEAFAVLLTWLAIKYLAPWVMKLKPKDTAGGASLILFGLMSLACLSMVSCSAVQEIVPSYTVRNDGSISGEEWEANEYHDIPSENVAPNINFRLPDAIGGGSLSGNYTPPAEVEPSK